jgi:hypothetical protein
MSNTTHPNESDMVLTTALAPNDCGTLAALFHAAYEHGVRVPTVIGGSLHRFLDHLTTGLIKDATWPDWSSAEHIRTLGWAIFADMVAEAVETEQLTEADIMARGQEVTDRMRDRYGLLVTGEDLLQAIRAAPGTPGGEG